MKLVIVSLTLAFSIIFSACGGQPNANQTAAMPASTAASVPTVTLQPEQAVKELVNGASIAQNNNNLPELENIYSDDCKLIKSNAKAGDNAGCLAALRAGDVKYERFSYDQVGVQVDSAGTGAIVTARATTAGEAKGKPFSTQFREKQTWTNTNGAWKIIKVETSEVKELPGLTQSGLTDPLEGSDAAPAKP